MSRLLTTSEYFDECGRPGEGDPDRPLGPGDLAGLSRLDPALVGVAQDALGPREAIVHGRVHHRPLRDLRGIDGGPERVV